MAPREETTVFLASFCPAHQPASSCHHSPRLELGPNRNLLSLPPTRDLNLYSTVQVCPLPSEAEDSSRALQGLHNGTTCKLQAGGRESTKGTCECSVASKEGLGKGEVLATEALGGTVMGTDTTP